MSAEVGQSLYPSQVYNDYYPFDDGDPNTGELYRDLIDDINAELNANSEVYLAGIFWLQGEEDAHSATYGPDYSDNLDELFHNLVDIFGSGFDFVISALSTYADAAGWEPAWGDVRTAQQDLADDYENVHLIDPDDMIDDEGYTTNQVFYDDVHYEDLAYDWLAESFFDLFPVGGNSPPDAIADAFTTDEDTELTGNVLADNGSGADSDPQGDTLTVNTTPVSDVSHGLLTLNANGSFSYKPDSDFNGTDSFTYEISDGHGGTDTATVTLTVDPVNDDPVAANDSGFSTVNTDPLEIAAATLLANDNDGDPELNQTLSIISVSGAVNGSVSLSGGTITFTPSAGHVGAASFTYVVSDGAGGTDTATVSLSTTPNQTPTANNDGYTTDEDHSVAGNVLGNDTDPEGDSLTATLVSDVSDGTLWLNPNGSFSYTPDADFNGTDSFTYQISDGHGGTDTATVTLTVDPVNDDPVAANDSGFSTANTVPLEIAAATLLANDTDGDPELNQNLEITSVGGAVNGTVSLSGGTITFTPSAGHIGPASFTYVLSDGAGGTDTATVSLSTGPNQAPTANDDGYAVNEDSTIAGNVLDNDTDPEDDSLTAALVSGPAQGVLTFAANGSFSYEADADLFDLAMPGAVIEQTFTYETTDAHGGTDLATVTLFVTILDDGETFVAADNNPDPMTGTDGGEDLILGGASKDRLYGLDGADTLRGGQGNDRLYGGISADELSGEGGDDRLYGDEGDDDLGGGAGDDQLSGDDGNDRLSGGGGDDTLRGNTGDDVLKGKHGRDLLKGGNGDDVLKGGAKDDTLKGGKDADLLKGGSGNDLLKGQDGDDRLVGGNGRDRMHGGDGADTFVFELGQGVDKVLDFVDEEDMLALKRLDYGDLDIAQTGDDTTISVGGTVIAVLLDVNAALITQSDFLG